ncbi:hypothetical protein DOTSEDRAFT_29275 [Dothistroma septosporum NZE10]|uniref:Uncharacterized protein n=1 Tax=Dothistroma septosporum (strain NZE10 / CBS 128990) TaxID=675120 RepID=N1PBF2_DOTSN|nr:hypothetical protein DOTSEDRAFT_29275 [Dothistroma septosporum NZE10]
MSKQQMREKWKRVEEYGGVELVEKARKRLPASAPRNIEKSTDPPEPEKVPKPTPVASKQPAAPRRTPNTRHPQSPSHVHNDRPSHPYDLLLPCQPTSTMVVVPRAPSGLSVLAPPQNAAKGRLHSTATRHEADHANDRPCTTAASAPPSRQPAAPCILARYACRAVSNSGMGCAPSNGQPTLVANRRLTTALKAPASV